MSYTVEKLHGQCLCPNSQGNYSVVTTETREGEGLWEVCNNCNLVINRSGVELQEFENFYNETYFAKNSYKKGAILSAREHFDQRKGSINSSYMNIEKYLSKDMRVLEIGAGAGELIYKVKDRVRDCMAIEMNKGYVEFIKQDLGIDAASVDYTKTEFDPKFDLIMAINTIDHMYNTLGVLKKIYHDLNAGGIAYIEVPNDRQALATMLPEVALRNFRKFMYQKAHYYSFTFETLSNALQWAGFHVEETISKHDYTVNNFLNWCFAAAPQVENKLAKSKTDIIDVEHPFAFEMNKLMKDLDEEFRKSITRHKLGESICVIAIKPGS